MRMRSYLMRVGSYLMIVGSSPMKLRSYSYETGFILEGMRECSSRQRVSLSCLAKGLHFFHDGCPKVSVCVIPQLGNDCLNLTNAPQWFYRSKTSLTALC